MERDENAGKLAETQFGCCGRQQLSGFSRTAIHQRIFAGRWRRTLPSVYAIAGAADTWEQRIQAALLWAGPASALSHLAAGAWYQLDGVKEVRAVEITVPRRQCPRHPDVIVHRSLWLGARDVIRYRGLRITRMARTLVDLAGLDDPRLLELALECALRRRQTTLADLGRYISRLDPGRRGLKLLRKLLAQRHGQPAHTDSALEVIVQRLLIENGLRPRRQLITRSNGKHVARVDLAFVKEKLILQCDGYEAHSSFLAWHRDRDVVGQLVAMGWRVMMVTWRDVEQRPAELVRRVRSALELGNSAG